MPAHRAIPEPTGPVLPKVFDLTLVVVGGLGVISILWWAASTMFGLGLVTFATGSMTPDFPVGSLALTEHVALDEVHVGDVVTIDRGTKEPPITHRVLSIRLTDGGHAAVVRLKGDANADPDPSPYDVTELHRVVTPLPSVVDVLRYTGTPISAGVIALLIAGALAWAFWPGAGERGAQTETEAPEAVSGRPVAVA